MSQSFFSIILLNIKDTRISLFTLFKTSPKCTGSRIVDLVINFIKIFNDRNMVRVTNVRTVPPAPQFSTEREREGEGGGREIDR